MHDAYPALEIAEKITHDSVLPKLNATLLCFSYIGSNIYIWKIDIILQLIDEVKYFAPSNKCASYLQLHSDWTNLTLIVFWKHKHNMFREAPE